MLVLVLLSLVLVVSGGPQTQEVRRRGQPRKGPCVALLELLPDDYTADEVTQLIEDFKSFLIVKKRTDRGDFVDYTTKECSPKLAAYTVKDPDQCDKYWDCSTAGKLTEKLCEDGMVYDEPGRSCNHPSRVDCTGRPLLQEARPSPGCPRQNGYFYTVDESTGVESCNSYVDCNKGFPQPYSCSAGLVYSLPLLSCVHPEQSGRDNCIQAIKAEGEFQCPDLGDRPRFGNHDRLAHPTDCQLFYTCLTTGQQIKGSCETQGKTVFDKDTGTCKDPADVRCQMSDVRCQGCQNYFDGKEEE